MFRAIFLVKLIGAGRATIPRLFESSLGDLLMIRLVTRQYGMVTADIFVLIQIHQRRSGNGANAPTGCGYDVYKCIENWRFHQ